MWKYNGQLTSDQWQRFYATMANTTSPQTSLSDSPDFGGYQIGGGIYAFNNPTGVALQDITSFSVLENPGGGCGSGCYRLTFTPPASTVTTGDNALRIKYSTTRALSHSGVVNDWFGYNNFTGTFAINPYTDEVWWHATTISDPTPTPGVAMNVNVNVGTLGLTAANFGIRAMFPQGCIITPSSLGPWTNGQVISQTITESGCGTSSFSLAGSWPTGLSGCSSGSGPSCVVSGTISGIGTFTPTVSFDTASNPYTIIVNAAPANIPSTSSSGVTGAGVSRREP